MKSFVAISLVGAVILAVYIKTLSHSIAGGDAGEIVAEGCALGTAHPPGYPLLTMLIYLIKVGFPTYETVAYRVNLFSACLTMGAAACMGFVVSRIRQQPSELISIGAIIVTMGMFCFSPLIWQYAVTAEVFPLNTFLAALIIALVLEFSRTHSFRIVQVGAFVCGLALCNQHTIILYEVPLILWMLFLNRRFLIKHPMEAVKLGVIFIIGLLPYLYLPIAATLKPEAGSWGHVTSVGGFLHHFLRKDYGTFQLFSGARGKVTESMHERNVAFVTDLWQEQGGIPTIVLALAGVAFCRLFVGGGANEATTKSAPTASPVIQPPSADDDGSSKSSGKKQSKSKGSITASTTTATPTQLVKPQATNTKYDGVSSIEAGYTLYVIVATLLFYLFVFHSLSNLPLSDKLLYGVHQRFWMQPNVIVFLLAGLGYQEILLKVESLLTSTASQNTNTRVPVIAVRIASVCIAVVLVLFQYRRNIYMSDQSTSPHFANYARALLGPLPSNAVLLINYDQQWTSVRYLQRCEGYRTDVTAINLSMMTYEWFKHKHGLYPHLTFPGTHHGVRQPNTKAGLQPFTLFEFLQANPSTDIYLSGKVSIPDPLFEQQYEVVPLGLVSKLTHNAKLPSPQAYMLQVQEKMGFVADQFNQLKSLPEQSKYPEVTWEWTIGRDFKDRLTDTAAYALDLAIKKPATNAAEAQTLVYALYLLESAVYLDADTHSAGRTQLSPATQLLKNAGLGRIHAVQNK